MRSLRMVNQIASEREQLLKQRDEDRIGVTINGVYQDDSIIQLVAPHIKGELTARIRRCEADLKQLGVELGP